MPTYPVTLLQALAYIRKGIATSVKVKINAYQSLISSLRKEAI